MSNATRFRILYNTPAHQVDQGQGVSLLRGAVVVTEADHAREIDALAAEIERMRAMNNALRANAEYGIRERDFLAARIAELEQASLQMDEILSSAASSTDSARRLLDSDHQSGHQHR